MDPISVAASLGAIIQLSLKAAKALKEFKHGSEDRITLREEIRGTTCLLEILRDRVEDAEVGGHDLMSISLLNQPRGPLDQLHRALYQLIKILAPQDHLHRISRALLWPLTKEEVMDLVAIIERQKTAFGLAMQNDNIALSLAIKAQVTEMRTQFAALENRSKIHHTQTLDQEHQDILAWLSPLNFWPRHQDIASTRTEGTGTWLLANHEFQAWCAHSIKRLWCAGIPGAGKTFLASVVIDHLKQTVVDENDALAFIYCNYKERAQQTHNTLVSSLIRQLIAKNGNFPSDLGSLYHRHSMKGTRPNQSELLGLLGIIASEVERVFLVVDALDECDDADGTRDALVPNLCTAVPNACILVTSRPYVNLQSSEFSRVEIRASDYDIRRYLRNQILHQPRLKRHTQADPSLLPLIDDTIVRKSDGMFLLARLHVGALATKNTRKALRSALHILPTELSTTYDDAVQRINDQNNEDAALAKNVLMWVSFAPNPLTVKELQHAIGAMALTDEPDLEDDDLPDSDIIIAVCAGLVVADKESHLVRLVHYTIQQYFDSNPVIPLPIAQRTMAETCLKYLSLGAFRRGPCRDNATLGDQFERYPFLRYAALNWGIHTQGETEVVCRDRILEFLSQRELRSNALQASSVTAYSTTIAMVWKRWSDDYPKGRSGLTMAATFGLTNIVERLVETAEDIDAGDNESVTALMCAADAGRTSTLEVLLDAGANIDKADVSGRTALVAAASNGRNEALKFLLGKGARVDAETVYKRTSLHHAVWQGHQSTATLLLNNGANAKAGNDLLQEAVNGGHTAMIELISDLTGDTQNGDGITSSLLNRVHYNRPSIANLEVLIKKGANLTQMGSRGYTPIHLASQKGHLDAVRLFLDQGVSPDIRDQAGHTPLHLATFRGSSETVELLLDRGANILAQNHAGETVLHTCLRYLPNENVVSLLLERGLKVDIPNAHGQTPLHQAARKGYIVIVKLLIDHGADASLETHGGWTPLEEAAASAAKDVVEMLREHTSASQSHRYLDLLASACLRAAISTKDDHTIEELLTKPEIDASLPDCDGRTGLHYAAYNGQTKVAETLLKLGASANAQIDDSAYRNAVDHLGHIPEEAYECQWVTPLHNAAGKGHVDIAESLLRHGANISIVGCEGYTVLNIAVHRGHANVVKLLLERGAQVEKEEEDGGEPTLIYWAASSGHKDVVRLLLEYGADEDKNGVWARRALVRATQIGYTDIVKLLQDHGFSTAER
ncbi:MAG: hypothetical protein LQ352_001499 [Teloschistes flavicans]|nr:MAG: hypothetical protein LQ352_001499 [Teloschistes flavicans]